MFNWEDLKNLHVVKKVKETIQNWWNVDILIIEQQALQGTSVAVFQSFSFNNPILKELFKREELCRAFLNKLQTYQNGDTFQSFSLLEKWDGVELNFLLIPINVYDHQTGFVVAIGFVTSKDQRELVHKQLLKQGLTEEWCSKQIEHLSILEGRSKEHFIYLSELIAKEILSVQEEIMGKSKKAVAMKKTGSSLWYGNIVGNSGVMQRLYHLLEQIKHSNNTILIQGENGTGKELIARSIHENSLRKHQNFILQNCSAFNDNLLESELFGHVKGAFTGAYKNKPGLFELANKGTFFLDEIGDTSPAMQVRLLRVIQEGTFFPVGGIEPKKVDVRIITATNRNLKQMVEEGSFREDLYYRLNVINIHAPALRERKEDIPLLAEFFINRLSVQAKVFTKKAMEKLVNYPWPGNVRELQNEAERLAIFSVNDTYIKEEFLSDKIKNKDNGSQLLHGLNNDGKMMKKAIIQLETQLISRCLKEEGGNKTRTAKKLGISRAALVSKVKDYKLSRKKLIKPSPIRKRG